MVELTPVNCRDTDVKVIDYVCTNSHLFVTTGPFRVQDLPSPEDWELTQNVQPMIENWVLDQELSHPDQQNVESDSPWNILYSDMNETQSYNGTQSSGLGINGLSDTRQWSDFFDYPLYDTMNTGDGNNDVEGRSPAKTTMQNVLELGTAPVSESIAEFDLETKPLTEKANGNEDAGHQKSIPGLAVSVKRAYVDCSPRQAKRQCRNNSLSDRESPVATPVSSSPARHLTKPRRPSVSLLSGSLLKNLVRGHGLRNYKTTYLLSHLDKPAETQKVKSRRKVVSKIHQRSNGWNRPTSDTVEEVAEAMSKLSTTV